MHHIESSDTNAILQVLSDGNWHSGQELAQQFQLSRTAVWKKISALQSLGLNIERLRGKGYRLEKSIVLLNSQALDQHLSTTSKQLFKKPQLLWLTDSTNTQAQHNGQHGYVCLAEMQTAARGRRAKAWYSPFASQVCMSLNWKFSGGIADIEGLSLVVGLSVQRAIMKLSANVASLKDICLKWPNDILYQNASGNFQKLGGILLEIIGDTAGPCMLTIGLGVNVDLHCGQSSGTMCQQKIDQPVTDLQRLLQTDINRNQLAAYILNELSVVLSDYAQTGFAYYRQAWIEIDGYKDAAVQVLREDDCITGIARGVDQHAQLLIETSEGIRALSGGELSLRLQDKS